mgnify:CR=1 FL=1
MYRLRDLALLAGVLCLGLSAALARSHEEREGEHLTKADILRHIAQLARSHGEREGEHGEPMGPPPFLWRDPNVLQAPESLRPIFQEAIDSGDLSEHAESLLPYLIHPREHREGGATPAPP